MTAAEVSNSSKSKKHQQQHVTLIMGIWNRWFTRGSAHNSQDMLVTRTETFVVELQSLTCMQVLQKTMHALTVHLVVSCSTCKDKKLLLTECLAHNLAQGHELGNTVTTLNDTVTCPNSSVTYHAASSVPSQRSWLVVRVLYQLTGMQRPWGCCQRDAHQQQHHRHHPV